MLDRLFCTGNIVTNLVKKRLHQIERFVGFRSLFAQGFDIRFRLAYLRHTLFQRGLHFTLAGFARLQIRGEIGQFQDDDFSLGSPFFSLVSLVFFRHGRLTLQMA